jgi:hypothetical protein
MKQTSCIMLVITQNLCDTPLLRSKTKKQTLNFEFHLLFTLAIYNAMPSGPQEQAAAWSKPRCHRGKFTLYSTAKL